MRQSHSILSRSCHVLIALACLAIGGCGPDSKLDLTTDAGRRMQYRNPKDRDNWLSPAQTAELIRTRPDLQLLFVGTVEDYRQGHLPRSMLIPVTGLRMTLDDRTQNSLYPAVNKGRKPSRKRTLLVYCWWNGCDCPTVPTYTELARRVLRERGYRDVYSLEGGMRAWKAADLPYETGEPAPSVHKPETGE